ncbi:MAG: hypothetical protein WC851_05180 [Candidatus Shapirobacteria bacterium]|jgi:hypothetical protein
MAIEAGKNLHELAFLGNNVTNEQYRVVVAGMAEQINKDILHGMDDPAKNKASRDLVEAASAGAYHNVQEVEDAITAKTDPNAEELRYFICDGVLLAMREGGDTKFSDALTSGDPVKIEAVLPKELRPWARDIRNRYIDDPNITAVIDQVTEWDLDDETELRRAGKALDALAATADPAQLRLARQAVRTLFDQTKAEKKGGGSGMGSDYMTAMLEMQKRDARENFTVWIGDLLASQPFNIMDEAKQKFVTSPDLVGIDISQFGPEGQAKWNTLVSVANTINKWAVSRVKSAYRPGEMMSPQSELSNVTKNEFIEMCNLEVNGEKPLLYAARELYQRLFEHDTDFPDDEVYALRFKRGVGNMTGDRVALMNEIAAEMSDPTTGILQDENLAKIFVATAAHLFCDVTMVDSADKSRGNNAWAIDGLRVEFSTGAKIEAKAGLEVDHDPAGDAAFGNKFFKWSRKFIGFGDRIKYKNGESVFDRMMRLKRERKVAILPRYTALSWQEMTCVEVEDGDGNVRELTIAQMLMGVGADNRPLSGKAAEVAEVHLSGGEGTDFFCGTYGRDIYPALYKMSQRMIGNKDFVLDMRDAAARTTQIEKLCNDRSDLLGKAWKPRGLKGPRGYKYANGEDIEKRPLLEKVWMDPVVIARVIQGATPMPDFPLHPQIIIATPEGPNKQPMDYDDYIYKLTGAMFGAGLDEGPMKRAVAMELGMKLRDKPYGPMDSAWWWKRKRKINEEVQLIALADRYTDRRVTLSE